MSLHITRVSLDAPKYAALISPTPDPPVFARPADTTQAQHTGRLKLCLKTNTSLCWMTEQAHVLQRVMKQERTKTTEAHSLVSRFFSFRLPSLLQALFYSLSLSLQGWKLHRVTVSGVKSPLYRLLCRPDIGSPLPVWSHRWRRWWSWKLAANLHSQRQFAAGKINMWWKAGSPNAHKSHRHLSRTLRPMIDALVVIRCLCVYIFSCSLIDTWCCSASMSAGWPSGNSFKYSYLLI